MKIKALVTGANGFLGTHLLRLLHAKGAEIHTLGTKPSSIGTYHEVTFYERSKLKDILAEVNPNLIFHLAGVSHSPDFRHFYDINVLFAANLIWALKQWGEKQCPLLLTGTSAEYGIIQESELPITEATPSRPYDHYGISKLTQTQMGQRESRDGWPIIIVRPFNVIGPGMPNHLVLQSLINQLKDIKVYNSQPILDVGNLSPQRDFVNAFDMVESMWRLIREPQAYGEVINVCSGIGVSVESLLRKLLDLTKMQVDIRVDPNRLKQVDIPVHFGSNEKQKRLTGYAPSTDVETTLRQILEFEGF
jgi:GDP-4-dehydro-6-deoxy-D-mannose reductase